METGRAVRDADAVNRAAWEGTSGSATTLPHQAAIQQSFGHHDVSGIEAHVGGPATQATADMGAVAYATGNQVAFGSSPSLHTAAHEAAHVVQQRAGVSLKSNVGEAGDSFEQHADAVADKVVAGESAQPLLDSFSGPPRSGGSGAVQRKVIQMEATPMTGATMQAPDISQGTQTNPQGVATGAPTGATPASTPQRQKVTIVANDTRKVRTAPGEAPQRDQIYTTGDHGQQVQNSQGTIEAPNTDPMMVDDCLFIAGQPQSGDIRQGGIGDCYFESVLLGIVNGDSGKITSMMSASGGNVSVTFFRFNASGNTWTPVTLNEPNTLQTRANGRLRGAGFRIAPQPKESFWYATIVGDTLQVWREDKFETAMWGPMMEKAYADFAQQYGKYGDGLGNGNGQQQINNGGGGYDIIHSGGEANKCYSMFYGTAATNGTVDVNYTPGAPTSLVMQNIAAVTNLVQFMEQRANPGPAGGAQRFLQARMSPNGAATRLKALIDIVRQRRSDNSTGFFSGFTDWIGATHDAENDAAFRASGARALADALDPVYAACNTYLGNSNATNSQALAVAARVVQAPGAFPILWANTDPIYTELRENLGIIINLGTDNGPGRRTMYAAHSYNVHSARFNKADGTPVAVTSGNVASVGPQIDAARSQVIMQNPHAGNEWDEAGTGAPDGANDGQFTLSLDQFLRSVDLLRTATVQQAPQVGDFPTPDPNGPQMA